MKRFPPACHDLAPLPERVTGTPAYTCFTSHSRQGRYRGHNARAGPTPIPRRPSSAPVSLRPRPTGQGTAGSAPSAQPAVGAAALYPARAERARRGRSRPSPPSPPSPPTTSALTPGWLPRGRRRRLLARPGQVFPQNLVVPYTLAGRRASSSSSVSGGEKGEAAKDGRGVPARGLSQVLLSEEDRMKKRDEKSACHEASEGKKKCLCLVLVSG
ncbi:uncharacterized protein [Vicugna pacos]|uniref:Uncharacterized protein n=1 Tax=Vicugna pacos TaxID=30538 RepID=A0ABM5DU27_VICPA